MHRQKVTGRRAIVRRVPAGLQYHGAPVQPGAAGGGRYPSVWPFVGAGGAVVVIVIFCALVAGWSAEGTIGVLGGAAAVMLPFAERRDV
ncbi:hypothetical protein ACIRST_40490 [Kitasatospora sp. NPDC101447]|uniref:hypothetical protein n=1 Tax=Kitasatospora sp. NPDC101447 TaxID=3364102 RepID=UPI0037F1D993